MFHQRNSILQNRQKQQRIRILKPHTLGELPRHGERQRLPESNPGHKAPLESSRVWRLDLLEDGEVQCIIYVKCQQ